MSRLREFLTISYLCLFFLIPAAICYKLYTLENGIYELTFVEKISALLIINVISIVGLDYYIIKEHTKQFKNLIRQQAEELRITEEDEDD